MPLLNRLGVTATCRASFALYNTKRRVDATGGGLYSAALELLLMNDEDQTR